MLIKMGSGSQGIDFGDAPKITFDGKWTGWRAEEYGGDLYWEAVFYTSGVLTAAQAYAPDVWGIGGGGGADASSSYGGGSGHTALSLAAALAAGTLAVSIGAGGTPNHKGGTTSLGSLLTCPGGGADASGSSVAAGGSGGSAKNNAGGSNGGDGSMAGESDGFPMCRFRDADKTAEAGAGGAVMAAVGGGGGGWLHWLGDNRTSEGHGYGAGGGGYSSMSMTSGHPGALVLRVAM